MENSGSRGLEVVEHDHYEKGCVVYAGGAIHVRSVYDYIWGIEKDFNKALEMSCQFALSKTKSWITNQYVPHKMLNDYERIGVVIINTKQ